MTGDSDFALVSIHSDPDIATEEIAELPTVVTDAITQLAEPDVICLGDFNADGSYYDEDDLSTVFAAGEYLIAIPNSADTNVAASDRTYDRIVMTSSTVEYYTGEWGAYRFDEAADFESLGLERKKVSDHYPVWAEFYVSGDSD